VASQEAETVRPFVPALLAVVFLTLINQGLDSAKMVFGACSFLVEGVSHQGSQLNDPGPAPANCPSIQFRANLAPGEQRDIPLYRQSLAVLRAERPAGIYFLSIYFRRDEELHGRSAGSLKL
jgi:hypothetical protein